MLNFGSVFRYGENFYVYLMQTEDTIYAAKILHKELTEDLVRSRNIKSRNPKNKVSEKPMYCFVVLSTQEFKGQAAHYGNPGMSPNIPIEGYSELNEADLKILKHEISIDKAAQIILRKTIKELFK